MSSRPHLFLVPALLGLLAVARPALGSEPQPIYGGMKVQPCGWPTTVSLGGCTGTLVHPELVIFAAHCMEGGYGPKSAVFGDNQSYPAFEVGTHSCKSDPKYGGSTGRDVAYCKLSKPVTSVPIVPILMGCETGVLVAGVDVVAVGFGQANDGLGWGPKREVAMKLNSIQGGEAFIGGNGKDTCYGDSGGPVFVRLADGSWRVFGITSYGEYCGGGGYYSMMHTAIDWLEQSSGIDLTPCHAQGAWAPTPGCGAFPLEPNAGGSSWAQGCANGKLSGASTTCGAAYDGSTGSGGTGAGGAGGGSSGGAGGYSGGTGGGDKGGTGGTGASPSSGGSAAEPGAGGGAPAGEPGCSSAPDCDACLGCVARCACLTGSPGACESACTPYGSDPPPAAGGASASPPAAASDNSAVTGNGCALSPRGAGSSWLLVALLGVLAFSRRRSKPDTGSVPELSESALELLEAPCDDPTVKRTPSWLPPEDDGSYRSYDVTRPRPFQSAPVLERTFDTPPRVVLPRLPPPPRFPPFVRPIAYAAYDEPRPRLSSLPPPVALTPMPIPLARAKRSPAPSWDDSSRTTRVRRSFSALRSELRRGRLAVAIGVLAGVALFTLWLAWVRAPSVTAATPSRAAALYVTAAGRGAGMLATPSVFVDGALRCSASPCRISTLDEGTHFVTVAADGYSPSTPRVVRLGRDEPAALHFELDPSTARVEPPTEVPAPSAPPPSDTAVSTQSIGPDGFAALPKPAPPIAPAAPAGFAELNLNSIPIANVVLDGRPLGPTPRLGVRVAPGDHAVVFVHPEHGRRVEAVRLVAGARRTVAVRFE